jgi:hypothetical protein
MKNERTLGHSERKANARIFSKWEWWYLFPLVIVCFFSYLNRNFQLDDAFIYLRYVRNFQDGNGLVYNPGERFNGLTSPLYSYFLIFASYFTHNYQFVSIAVSGFFLYLTSIVSSCLITTKKAERILSSVLITCLRYFYGTFGLETTLFLFLIVVSLYLYKIGSDYFVLSLALLMVTRPEGVFLSVVLLTFYFVEQKRMPQPSVIIFSALVFCIPFMVNYLFYGHLISGTGNAKMGQGRTGIWGGRWAFLIGLMYKCIFWRPIYLIFLAPLVTYGFYISRKQMVTIRSVIFLLILLLFYLLFNLPNYPWYYAPFILFATLFLSVAIVRIASILFSARRYGACFAFCAIASFILVKSAVNFRSDQDYQAYTSIGKWLKNNTPDSANVAMVEIGTIGWHSDRKIIDILGLVNPHNADYIGEKKFCNWLFDYQPDFILIHEPVWPQEVSSKLLLIKGLYSEKKDFSFNGFKLLEKAKGVDNRMIVETVRNNIPDLNMIQEKYYLSKSTFRPFSLRTTSNPPPLLKEVQP